MTRSRTIRSYIGCVLLIAFACASSAVLLKRSIAGEIKPTFNAEMAHLEKKLERAKTYLTPRGIIGYIDDDENVLKSAEAARAYIMTQYILAPLVIVKDTDRKIILGNFSDRQTGIAIAEKNGLRCVADLGNGAMVLQRKAERK